MAEHNSVQMVDDYRKYPVDDHGKLRFLYFSIAALPVAYAADDTVLLCQLPPGRKRILPWLCRFTGSAFGSGRTIDIGHKAYMKRPAGQDLEAIDVDAFADGLDVSGATNAIAFGTVMKFDMYSLAEVDVIMTILGGTMPIGATASGMIAYIYE